MNTPAGNAPGSSPERTHVVVNVAIPFVQTFVRRRRQKSEDVWVRRHHPISVSVMDPQDAPVAYRITPVGYDRTRDWCERPYDVLAWKGRFWWPVRDHDEASVSRESFIERAERHCDPYILSTLGCEQSDRPAPPAERYFEEVLARELHGSTFDRQRMAAESTAHELAFCNGVLMAAAGPPVWYALDIFDVPHVVAGASLLVPGLDSDYGLPRPYHYERQRAAERGLVLDIELNDFSQHPVFRSGELHSRVDRMMANAGFVADDVCSCALADRIRREFEYLYRDDVDFLARHMPLLSKIIDGKHDLRTDHRDVLAELLRADIGFLDQHAEYVPAATAILDRIAVREAARLTREEDDALWSIESNT